MAKVVFENRFDVPPEYAAKWLTDIRPDDGQRFFQGPPGVAVTRKGNEIHTEGPHTLGWARGQIVVDSPTAWHATTEMMRAKGTPVQLRGRIQEHVRPEGTGTYHRAEVDVEAMTLMAKLMMAVAGKRMMERDLKAGFAKVKQEMEAEFRAGKPPTG